MDKETVRNKLNLKNEYTYYWDFSEIEKEDMPSFFYCIGLMYYNFKDITCVDF